MSKVMCVYELNGECPSPEKKCELRVERDILGWHESDRYWCEGIKEYRKGILVEVKKEEKGREPLLGIRPERAALEARRKEILEGLLRLNTFEPNSQLRYLKELEMITYRLIQTDPETPEVVKQDAKKKFYMIAYGG